MLNFVIIAKNRQLNSIKTTNHHNIIDFSVPQGYDETTVNRLIRTARYCLPNSACQPGPAEFAKTAAI